MIEDIINLTPMLFTFVFGALAASFSYLAYRHTKERFRLELFEKRWEIYERTLEFCSGVIKHGGIPKHGTDEKSNNEIVKVLIAANESVIGMGHHKTRALFGSEIHKRFDELNKAYAWLRSFKSDSVLENYGDDWYEQITVVVDFANDMPELFKPYVYFGDYKAKK